MPYLPNHANKIINKINVLITETDLEL